MNNKYTNPGANVVMKTYHITFTAKGKQQCMSFVARSQAFAEQALQSMYAGITVKVLYVVTEASSVVS